MELHTVAVSLATLKPGCKTCFKSGLRFTAKYTVKEMNVAKSMCLLLRSFLCYFHQ